MKIPGIIKFIFFKGDKRKYKGKKEVLYMKYKSFRIFMAQDR